MNVIRTTAAHALLALAVTACASASAFEGASAEELAAGAEQLAAHLESEATCEAREQADLLLARAREGETAGEVPADVVERIEHVAARVQREVPCEPAVTDDADTDAVDTDAVDTSDRADEASEPAPPADKGNGKDKKDKDNGKGKG